MIFEKYDTIYLSDKWFCLLFGQNGAFITTLRQWVLSRLAFCNIKLDHDSMEMWLVCTAIGENHDLIDKMQKNEDGTYPVVFSVGGVELDFGLVAKEIDKQLCDLIAQKAQELLNDRYEDLLSEITDIQERIENQKEKFRYDWENDTN